MNNKTITIDIEKLILFSYYLDNEVFGMMIRLIIFSRATNGISKSRIYDLINKNTCYSLDDTELSGYKDRLIELFCVYDESTGNIDINESLFKNIIIDVENISNHISAVTTTTQETKPKTYMKKLKRNETFIIPSLDEVIEYFLVNGYTSETAEKAFKYYSAANWMDSNNRPVTNWKQKMLGVWFKEQYKIKSTSKS